MADIIDVTNNVEEVDGVESQRQPNDLNVDDAGNKNPDPDSDDDRDGPVVDVVDRGPWNGAFAPRRPQNVPPSQVQV